MNEIFSQGTKKQKNLGFVIMALGFISFFASVFYLNFFNSGYALIIFAFISFLLAVFGIGYSYGGLKKGFVWIGLWLFIGILSVIFRYLLGLFLPNLQIVGVLAAFLILIFSIRLFLRDEISQMMSK